MSSHHAFEILIALHITTGAPGLITFWIPVLAKKGGRLHQIWGRVFTFSMLATGTFAMGMGTMTLWKPMETHPQLVTHAQFSDPELVRGIFGWMMLYLAILTVNLTWYGWSCIQNRNEHTKNRTPFNVFLQGALLIASSACLVDGVVIGQPMMMGISMVGFATVATNLMFMLKSRPGPVDWLLEHIKGIVGTGISVYTAFFAFGAVRLVPELALTPMLWAIPLVTGLTLILYHQRAVTRRLRKPSLAAAE